MREARRAFDDEGVEGMVRVIRDKLGDDADNVLREMGLDEYIDDAANKADDVVDDVVGVICSFSGDTLVSTIAGLEAISALEEGDWVLAYDETTGNIGYYPILGTWVHDDPVIVLLTIDGETIETTPEHPFYTEAGDWVAAGALQEGDRVQKADGSTGTVEAVALVYQVQPMYNLTVATAHTFFVGEGRWLVHNVCIRGVEFRGLIRNRPLSELTGNQIENALTGAGLRIDDHHVIQRLRERGSTLADLEKLINHGNIYDAGNGVHALVDERTGMALLYNNSTGGLVGYRPRTPRWTLLD